MQELQRQVASLKHKLNHTEETQKDFVELSQSLQVSLRILSLKQPAHSWLIVNDPGSMVSLVQ